MTAPGGAYAAFRPELHPRDSKGRFRDKWGLPAAARKLVDGIVSRFAPKLFPSDNDAQGYLDTKAGGKKRTPLQQKALASFTGNGSAKIQADLRAGKANAEAGALSSMVEPLSEDLILTRVVGAEAFGLQPQQIMGVEEWTGKLVRDRGFAPTNVGTPFQVAGPHVTMSILAPKGTQAIIPGGSREVILDRDQPLRIVKVDPDGRGGVYVYMVAQPSPAGRSRALGRKLGKAELAPAVDATPDEAQKRGLAPDGAPATPGNAPEGAPAQAKGAGTPGQAEGPAAAPAQAPQEVVGPTATSPEGNVPQKDGQEAPADALPDREVLKREVEVAQREAEVARREAKAAKAAAPAKNAVDQAGEDMGADEADADQVKRWREAAGMAPKLSPLHETMLAMTAGQLRSKEISKGDASAQLRDLARDRDTPADDFLRKVADIIDLGPDFKVRKPKKAAAPKAVKKAAKAVPEKEAPAKKAAVKRAAEVADLRAAKAASAPKKEAPAKAAPEPAKKAAPKAAVKKAAEPAPKASTMDPEDRARARQAEIDKRRKVAVVHASLMELLSNDAEPEVLRRQVEVMAKRGAIPDADRDAIFKAIDDGDMAKVKKIGAKLAADAGLRPIGEAGAFERFDPKRHQVAAPGDRIDPGDPVEILRPGHMLDLDGEEVRLGKAVVIDADESDLAPSVKKAAPEPAKKAAPEPAKKAAPEPAKKAVPEPAKKAVPEPAKKAAPEPAGPLSHDESMTRAEYEDRYFADPRPDLPGLSTIPRGEFKAPEAKAKEVAPAIAKRWNPTEEELAALSPDAKGTFEERKRKAIVDELSLYTGGGSHQMESGVEDLLDELGLPYLAPDPDSGAAHKRDEIRRDPAKRRAIHGLVRAVYENTQEWLRDNNITEVTAARSTGMKGDRGGLPFTAWTTNYSTMRTEAGHNDWKDPDAAKRGRPVRIATIPAKHILATPETGYGSMSEAEVVALALPKNGDPLPAKPSAPSAKAPSAPKADTLEQRRAGRAKARERQQDIAHADVLGETMAEMSELEAKGADDKVVAQHVRAIARGPLVDEVKDLERRDKLRKALEDVAKDLDAGKEGEARFKVLDMLAERDVRIPGWDPDANNEVKFDPKAHEGFVGDLKTGEKVVLVRPMTQVRLPDGEIVTLRKAKVARVPDPADDPRQRLVGRKLSGAQFRDLRPGDIVELDDGKQREVDRVNASDTVFLKGGAKVTAIGGLELKVVKVAPGEVPDREVSLIDAPIVGTAAIRVQEKVPVRWHHKDRDLVAGLEGLAPAERKAVGKAIQNYVFDKPTGGKVISEPRVNSALRGDVEMTPALRRDVELLDVAMDNSKLKEPITVYRGYQDGTRVLPEDWDSRDLAGHTWSDPGFTSTSAERETGAIYAGSAENRGFAIRIKLKKGQSALSIMDDVDGMDNEGEIVLPHGLEFKVVKDNGVQDGIRWLDVEVGPKAATPASPAAPTPGPASAAQRAEARLKANRERPLDKRLVKDLRQIAKEENVALRAKDRKADIIAAIEEARANRLAAAKSPAKPALPKRVPLAERMAPGKKGPTADGPIAFHWVPGLEQKKRPSVDEIEVMNEKQLRKLADDVGLDHDMLHRASLERHLVRREEALQAIERIHRSREVFRFEDLEDIAMKDLQQEARRRGLPIPLLVNKDKLVKLLEGEPVVFKGEVKSLPGDEDFADLTTTEMFDLADLAEVRIDLDDTRADLVAKLKAKGFAHPKGPVDQLHTLQLRQKLVAIGIRIGKGASRERLVALLSNPVRGDWHAAPEPRREKLISDVASGVAGESELGGGAMGETFLVDLANGAQAVRKRHHHAFGTPPGQQADAEQLAADVAKAVGAPTPPVWRQDGVTIWMGHVKGTVAGKSTAQEVEDAVDSPDGLRLGLLDAIIGNPDRHSGNWMIDSKGKPVGIDHGLAWDREGIGASGPVSVGLDGVVQPGGASGSFIHPFVNMFSGEWLQEIEFSQSEAEKIRERLVKLRPQFETLDRMNWYETTLARLDVVIDRATLA